RPWRSSRRSGGRWSPLRAVRYTMGRERQPSSKLLVDAAEFLDPLARLYLRGVEVPLPVDRDVVERGELARLAPGPAEAADDLLGDALDDAHLAVHAVDHVHEALAALGREHEVVHRAVAARLSFERVLGDEAAVLAEDLQPVVGAVADVHQAVDLREADAVHRIAELRRRGPRRIVRRGLLVARPLAVRAPVALVRAALGIEHHHPAVSVAVGGVDLARRDVDRDVGGRAEPVGGVAVVSARLPADLQHELALHRELEELAVGLAVAREPDEVVGVDVDAVLALGPLVARARAAPREEEIARG